MHAMAQAGRPGGAVLMLDFNSVPKVADLANAEIDAGLQAGYRATAPRTYLGGSRLGHPCERALQFEYGMRPRTRAPPFDGRTLRIFAIGHALEDSAAAWLRGAGFDLYTRKGNRLDGGQAPASPLPADASAATSTYPCAHGPTLPGLGLPGAVGMQDDERAVRGGRRRRRAWSLSKPVYAAQLAVYQGYMEASVAGISANPALFTAIIVHRQLHHAVCRPAPGAWRTPPRPRGAHPAGDRRRATAAAHRRQPRLMTNAGCAPGRNAAGACRHERRRRQCHPLQPVARLQRRADGDRRRSVRPRGRCGADRRLPRRRLRLLRGLDPVPRFHRQGSGFAGRPHNIWVEADGTVAAKAVNFAGWAAREGAAFYVVPGTVGEHRRAKSADIRQMQTVPWPISTPATSPPSLITCCGISASRRSSSSRAAGRRRGSTSCTSGGG